MRGEELDWVIAEKIKAVRLATGLSQRTFAERLGYSERAMGSYERGERRPSLDVIEAIIYEFETTPEFFLGTLPGSKEMDEKRLETIKSMIILAQLLPDKDLEKAVKHLKIELEDNMAYRDIVHFEDL